MTIDIPEFGAMTIKQFCTKFPMSLTMFYNLLNKGEAPAIMRVGAKVLITHESARDWCKRFEVKQSIGEPGAEENQPDQVFRRGRRSKKNSLAKGNLSKVEARAVVGEWLSVSKGASDKGAPGG